jgi:hypothetical protein
VFWLFLPLQCLPTTVTPDNKGTTTGSNNEPPKPSPKAPVPSPSPTPAKLREDLTCGCDKAIVTAQAVSQAIATAGGDCRSPAGQALAQAYAEASAAGNGQAVAEALAAGEATAAQKVGIGLACHATTVQQSVRLAIFTTVACLVEHGRSSMHVTLCRLSSSYKAFTPSLTPFLLF